jgi:putative membrane protein
MVDLHLLLMVTYCSMIGSLVGTVSGLVPGIHVNTLALGLMVIEPWLSSVMEGTIMAGEMDAGVIPLLISVIIVSAAMVHSFLDFIPSIFLGAPDSSDALSVLPGHRMLMGGRGMEAVRCSASGSLVGALVAILLAAPSHLLMGEMGIYDALAPLIPLILLGVICVLVISERHGGWKGMGWSLALIASSGLLGHLVLNATLPLNDLNGLGQSLLFPLLTGLFGMPTLMLSLHNPSIPEQAKPILIRSPIRPSLKGVLSGGLVGWFPGVTSTTGAVMGSLSREDHDAPSFITTVSAVGSSAAVFSMIALSVTGKGRTGAMLAVIEIMGEDLPLMQHFPSQHFALLLLSALISSAIGFYLTLRAGKAFSRFVSRHDMARVSKGIIVLVLAMVVVFNGFQGIPLILASTLLGLVPPMAGVGRVHLTGCLLVPVILFFIF